MKPKLPSDVKNGMLCDRKGVPIYTGDLLRTHHFIDFQTRTRRYMYHAVTCRDGVLRMTPVQALATADRGWGGECYLHTVADAEGVLPESDVIDGWYGGHPSYDRKKRKVGK